MTVYVWNATVSNLTLMALGSSAPEILLSLIEITSDNFFLGALGAGTIVGSAAFNLLIISAVCVCAIPDGEVRKVKEVHVYIVTASTSVFAYLWLMFILIVSSPDVCQLWEGVVTLLMCPLLVFVAYLADRGYFKSKNRQSYVDKQEAGNFDDQTIAEDATEEELMQIQQDIRDQHGQDLTDDQVVKIMRVQYFNKRSRAYYRHAAMEKSLHGKSVDTSAAMSVQEAITTSDDIQRELAKKTVFIGVESEKYAYLENVGKASVVLMRTGPEDCKASVKYITKEGTAKAVIDYTHSEGTITFEKGETRKEVLIPIVNDTAFENDEEFYVELSEPTLEENQSSSQVQLAEHFIATVVIIDDDLPGELRFEQEQVISQPAGGDQIINVHVHRYNGGTGKISCSFNTDNMTAVDGVDFEGTKGKLEFEEGQQDAIIPITIKARTRAKDASLNIVITDAVGTKFDEKTDGGEEQCICHVTIRPKGGKPSIVLGMRDRIHSANAIMGHKNWGQQFRDALFDVGGGDDEEEDSDEPKEASGPSKMDYFMHVVSLPWKLLFAFVPPVDYCGGWACFCGALCMIAVITAIVGDMANLVGCCLDMYPETAAITFVALGTSLPDTFASKTAAEMDPYADASIGNVTGSNCVNVFLGIGIAWTLAAVVWETGDQTPEWSKRVMKLSPGEIKNVAAVTTQGGNAVFVAPAGTLWFNLAVFSVNAFFALQHLYARRKKFGGELGGPKGGMFGQYFSAGFLIFQWFIYIIASTVFAALGDPLTYADLAAQ